MGIIAAYIVACLLCCYSAVKVWRWHRYRFLTDTFMAIEGWKEER